MPVVECDVTLAREQLKAAGATIEPGNTDHEQWRASLNETTAVAYEDKIVIQGTNPFAIESLLQEHSGRVHLYFDGASHGNPGPAAIGWVLISSEGVVAEQGATIGHATNNQAEYEALIHGLEAARNYGFEDIHIRGDSELIIRQVRGEWNTNDPALRERRVKARELLDTFDEWAFTHVPREINTRANDLATDALEDD